MPIIKKNSIHALDLDIFVKKNHLVNALDLDIFLPYLDMVVYGHQIVVMKDINLITYFSSVLFQLYWECMFHQKKISCHSALPISFTHFG